MQKESLKFVKKNAVSVYNPMNLMLNGPPHTIAHCQTRGGDSRGGTVSFCFYPIDRSREVPELLCPLTTQLSHSPALKRAFQTEFPEVGGQIPSYLFFWSRFSVFHFDFNKYFTPEPKIKF